MWANESRFFFLEGKKKEKRKYITEDCGCTVRPNKKTNMFSVLFFQKIGRRRPFFSFKMAARYIFRDSQAIFQDGRRLFFIYIF